MSRLALEAAIERARREATTGDATRFHVELQAIQTLDRAGQAPTTELRMLELVARARQADTASVDRLLDAMRPIAPSDWRQIRAWLVGAPEMEQPLYADFVRNLDRLVRLRTSPMTASRLTPILGTILVCSAITLAILSWRLSPVPPEDSASAVIRAVLEGDAAEFLDAMPAEWRATVLSAGRALAAGSSEVADSQARASIDELSAALTEASRSTGALPLARQLLGPAGSVADLRRLAEGVKLWGESPWLRMTAWGDGTAVAWRPAGEATLVWRTLLRHAPLGSWLPGWFGVDWRAEALSIPPTTVRLTASDEASRTLDAQVGSASWAITAVPVGHRWIPQAMTIEWPRWRVSLEDITKDLQSSADAEESLIASIDATTSWVRAWSDGETPPAPDDSVLPWWVP